MDRPEYRGPELSERQAVVLRSMVSSYLGDGEPVGSLTVSHLLPVPLSAASIRNTMAELAELGLIEKPHASAGRLPTAAGLRLFVDRLLDPIGLPSYEKRALAWSVDETDSAEFASCVSALLSERTRLLGFVVVPRIDRIRLRHVSLVRVARDRLLVSLVSRTGASHRRFVEAAGEGDQAELDRFAALLSERVDGLTLPQVRARLEDEARELRSAADRVLARALSLGSQVLAPEEPSPADLVIATRLALLDQPEFSDPARVRELFAALEDKERLIGILDELIDGSTVRVAFGEEVDAPSLRRFAVVATSYGGERPLGALGVIGPSRMDYGRVIPLVDYLSQVVTEKLSA